MRATRYYYNRWFKCPVCGNHQSAPKRKASAKGHIKTMYCFMCKHKRDFEMMDVDVGR